MGAQYTLRISAKKTSRLELTADVFNVLNTQNLSGYANNATQSNQIQTGAAGSGIIRRNASAPASSSSACATRCNGKPHRRNV